LTKCY